jgi:hypothetical protein
MAKAKQNQMSMDKADRIANDKSRAIDSSMTGGDMGLGDNISGKLMKDMTGKPRSGKSAKLSEIKKP